MMSMIHTPRIKEHEPPAYLNEMCPGYMATRSDASRDFSPTTGRPP
jgi:hypothetical protein